MALTAEQIEARRSSIGSSDIGTVLGVNPYKTVYELWLEKLGKIEPDQSSFIAHVGQVMEDPIASVYSLRTGQKTRKNNQQIKNDKWPWLTGHIDRKVEGIRKGLEIKNVSPRMYRYWGKDGTDEVAQYYLPQPYSYMMLLDYPEWEVAAYFGGDDLRIYPLERNKEVEELIVEATHNFWYEYVLKEIPPELDYAHKSTDELLTRLYKDIDGEAVELPSYLMHWHRVKEDAEETIRSNNAVVQEAKNRIRHAMGKHAVGVLPDGTGYSRKTVNKKEYTVAASSYTQMRFTKNPKIF